MEIGSYIKLHRQKQEMTQADLAEGIVSFAYLSKIENGKTEASPEVISLLCTRLGIQLDNEKEIEMKEKCQEWFSQLFEASDKQEIVHRFNELEVLMEENHSEILVLYEIYKVRYFLLLGDYEQALTQINRLADLSSTFDSLHQFYWYKFKGNYSSVVGEFNQAMRMYELAEEKLNQLELSEDEIADLQYIISVTHSKLRNTVEAVEYANKALDVFQRQYNFLRCAQCHIMLGISYRRIKMHDKAIKNYNLAKHLGNLNKDKRIIQLTNQNLGYLHSSKGSTEEAIHYYLEVVDDSEVDLHARVTAAASLIKEYYSIEYFDKAKEMVDKGYELLKRTEHIETYKIYRYMINTYYYALNNERDQFESLVINEFIPFLKKHKDYANLVDYANMLGSHFEALSKYKDAAKYFKLANTTYEELVNL